MSNLFVKGLLLTTLSSEYVRVVWNQRTSVPMPDADFTGKVVIVTGANVGLGLEASRHFVRLGAAKVIMGCRNLEKAEAAKTDIESSPSAEGRQGVVEVWQVDLSSFQSVREFCHRASQLERLDAVIENAAVAMSSYAQSEGHEMQVQVNVLSTFLICLMLLPTLRRTAAKYNTQTHVPFVSSVGHFWPWPVNLSDPPVFERLKSPESMYTRYTDTKLMIALIARELASRLASPSDAEKTPVIVNSLEPGFCRTELFRQIPAVAKYFVYSVLTVFSRSPEMGSRTLVFAASAGYETHGKYLMTNEIIPGSDFMSSAAGIRSGKLLCDEMLAIFDQIEPDVSKNILGPN